jgi:xanthine dehydrogenase accessory factor
MLRASGARQAKRFPLGAALGQICGGAANLLFERVSAGAEWVRILCDWSQAGTPCVIATPFGEHDDGHLLVSAAATWGTVGASERDARVTDEARKVLTGGESAPRTLALGDGKSVILEALRPVDFQVVLFGAGHVGRALARVLGVVPCRVTWVDGRAHEFPADVPSNVRLVVTDAALAEAARAPSGSCFLVMTHSHALDFELVEAILRRGDFAYCGMIGSATKRRTFENGFAKRGISPTTLTRFTCPIGIPGIKGKEPGAIAVAVAAELLELRERATTAGAQHEAARA